MAEEFRWLITALIVPAIIWLARNMQQSQAAFMASQSAFISHLQAEAGRSEKEREKWLSQSAKEHETMTESLQEILIQLQRINGRS